MRPVDASGIIEHKADLRARYGAFAYRAPIEGRPHVVPSRPTPPVRNPAIESLNIQNDTPRAKRLRIETIVGHVCEAWEITRTALLSRSHARREARPRFALYWLVSEHVGLSLPRIGHLIGHRDHSTIMSGIERAKDLYAHDVDWRQRYDRAVSGLSKELGGTP